MVKLSPRLQAIVDLVPNVECIADIGSDHAYVPIWLVQQKRIQRAIASEVAAGPKNISQKDIMQAQLQDKISTRLADGLTGLKTSDQVNVAIIAGMGGQLIKQILQNGQQQLQFIPQLILEPNNDEPGVRTWLSNHCWQIADERIVQEGHHIYEIILAQRQNREQFLNSQQIMFGPQLLLQHSPIFVSKWQRQLKRSYFMYNNLQNAQTPQPEKIKLIQERIKQIEEVLT